MPRMTKAELEAYYYTAFNRGQSEGAARAKKEAEQNFNAATQAAQLKALGEVLHALRTTTYCAMQALTLLSRGNFRPLW